MKKIAKLSLVAAVAVAGMTTASAASLEESIKGVDISGMVRYRFTEGKVENKPHKQENRYDVEVNAKVPVNDMVKAIIKVDVIAKLGAKKNETNTDGKPSVNIEDAYFSYTNSGFIVNAGKQNVPGPLTDSLNGTGIVAMAPVGPVTLAGAYFNGTALDTDDDTKGFQHGGRNIAAIAAMASFDMVNLDVWYADVQDLASAYSIGADAKVGPVSLATRYSEKDLDGAKGDANKFSTFKFEAEAEVGIVGLVAGYAKSGKAGTAELTDGNDAKVNDFGGEQLDITSFKDLDLFKIGASVSPVDNVDLGLEYYYGEADKDEADEILGKVAYKMSKNFKISTFYSHAKTELDGKSKTKANKGRIELKYTF